MMKKSRMVKKLLHTLIAGACLSSWAISYAAEQELFWGNLDTYAHALKHYTLKPSAPTPNKAHVRYDQYYLDIPVWGSQVIFHENSTGPKTLTGALLKNIAKDIPNLDGKLSNEDVKKIAVGKHSVVNKINIEKVIYFDQDTSSKALLAYHVSYLLKTEKGPSIPSFIIDANTGKILEQWNALPTIEIGQGAGGVNVNRLPYRAGKFQYGSTLPNTNSLGKLDVTIVNDRCVLSNNLYRVINLRNLTERQLPFELPASNAEERRYQINPFQYTCAAPNYINTNDAGFSPINDGFSPINDVNYFVKQTFNMLMNQYQVPAPIGNQLPIRVYTHLGLYDNAYACGPTCMRESNVIGPQTLVFGNGYKDFSPITDGDGVSHEFGHLVTENFSNLVYNGHAGGINESFSDMTGMAMLYYQSTTLGYSWYWNNQDWTTGASVSKDGKPLRYLDSPSKDGHSIENVSQFKKGMDPHFSSGIFNKAYYLLSTTPNWNAEKAYRVMLDANMNYWTKNTTFKMAACGVQQAAKDRAYNDQDVKDTFIKVGINMENCRI